MTEPRITRFSEDDFRLERYMCVEKLRESRIIELIDQLVFTGVKGQLVALTYLLLCVSNPTKIMFFGHIHVNL